MDPINLNAQSDANMRHTHHVSAVHRKSDTYTAELRSDNMGDPWDQIADIHEARQILKRPVFGNQKHILCVRLLAMVEEIIALSGGDHRLLPCPCCKGSGGGHCGECGSDTDCHKCRGSGRVRLSQIEYSSPQEIGRMLEAARREARVQ